MHLCRLPVAVLICILGLNDNTVSAQGTKYAGEFLRIGVGPRALGMGGAFVSVADDATAGYWNPAGLAFLTGRAFSLMHSEQVTGLAYDYAAYAHPRGQNNRITAYGISLIRLGLDDIPITALPDPSQPIDALLSDGQRNRPFVDRFVSNVEYALLVSFARRTSDRFSMGGNLKLVQKSLDVASAFGLGFDAGVMIRPTASLAIGVHVMNLTSTVLTWNTGRKEYIVPMLKIGVAYARSVPRLRGNVIIATDVDILFEGRNQTASRSLGSASGSAHVGLEYRLKQAVTLRLGIQAAGLTAGAGLRTPSFHLVGQAFSPSLDYAFVNDAAFGAVHRIGTSIEF